MYSNTDMLSFDELDNDVDRLFRAYCDTSLIEFGEGSMAKGASKFATTGYWAKVVVFRRLNLCPYDRPDMLQLASPNEHASPSEHASPKLKDTPRISVENFKHASRFLYWFDTRAAYWATAAVDPSRLEAYPPAKKLLSLYKQMLVVQERIDNARLIEEKTAKSAAKSATGPAHAKAWTGKDTTIFLASRVAHATQPPIMHTDVGARESDE